MEWGQEVNRKIGRYRDWWEVGAMEEESKNLINKMLNGIAKHFSQAFLGS